MTYSLRIAQTLLVSVCALLVALAPLFATAATVYEQEAERAESAGMNKETTQGSTHLVADEKYEGSVTFSFDLEQGGHYRIEAKTIAPDKQHDSFEVRVNGGPKVVWHVPNSTSWLWNPVATQAAPKGVYELAEGHLEVTLYGREVTRIDRLKVVLLEKTSSTDVSDDSKDTDVEEVDDAPKEEQLSTRGRTLHVSTKGSDTSSGNQSAPLRNIQTALAKADAGDTVVVAGGTYREELQTLRSGTKDAPITIVGAQGSRPVLDLGWSKDGPKFHHSHYVFKNFELKNFNQGIRIEDATNVLVTGNEIHHGKHECVRVRHFAKDNTLEGNTIHDCGYADGKERLQNGNGEGVYVGTAPEQRERNGGKPDTSTSNKILKNTIYNVTESIDIKEDSSYTLVKGNRVYKNSDSNSGAINVRGDNNRIEENHSSGNSGSGFRAGGDENIKDPSGKTHDYGVGNTFRNNTAEKNKAYGYKLMQTKQDFDCSNTSTGNGSGDANASGICFR